MMVLRRVPMLIPVLPGSSGLYAPGPGLPLLVSSRLLSRPDVPPRLTRPTRSQRASTLYWPGPGLEAAEAASAAMLVCSRLPMRKLLSDSDDGIV